MNVSSSHLQMVDQQSWDSSWWNIYFSPRYVTSQSHILYLLSTDNVSAIPRSIRWLSPNTTSSLEDLFRGFFRFYADFNFERDAISVFLGKRRDKLTMDKVEVENPLDR